MIDERTKEILHDLFRSIPRKSPKGLVKKFIDDLKDHGVEILTSEYFPNWKFFAAEKNGRELIILAHESTNIEFWGQGKDIVDRIKDKPIDWGIVLLEKDHRRGFWIHKDYFFDLVRDGMVTMDSENKNYKFNAYRLREKPELAKTFWALKKFLNFVGWE